MNLADIVHFGVTCFEHGIKFSGPTKVEAFLDHCVAFSFSRSAVLRVLGEVK
jgi:hypothetical protein